MRFAVEHLTRYAYDRPVFIEPMVVRLRPRPSQVQRHRDFALTIEPEPAGRTEAEDAEGNLVTHVWFTGTTDSLTLRSSFVAETQRENPFDFVVLDPAHARVPMSYPEHERAALARFLDGTGEVEAFAREMLDEAGPEVVPFLDALTKRIHEHVAHEVREEGPPHPAAQTLASGTGTCRDATVLFIEVCRSVGLAARFVSGYQEAEAPLNPDEPRYLHAWAEVYLSGAGWRGFDPSHAIAVADRHIALAAAPDAAGAAPTSGSFRGTEARARMDATIAITPF